MASGDYGWGASGTNRRRRGDDRYFGRGLAYSLLVVPVAVPVWLIIWQSGWISSIVAFGTAFGAAALFRYGAKGQVSTRGAVAISIVSFVTILLCVTASMLFDASKAFAPSETMFGGLSEPGFWDWLTGTYLADPSVSAAVAWSAALSLFLAALGALPTLIGLLRGRSAGGRVATMLAPVGVAVTAVAILAFLTANGYGGGMGGPSSASGSGGGAAAVQPDPAFTPPVAVGSCVLAELAPETGGELSPPEVVPCDQAHDAEVVHVGAVDEAVSGPGYPGHDWLSAHTGEECAEPMTTFLGVPWEQSGLQLRMIYPSQESWDAGDRAVSCWVQNPAGQTTGTLQGAGAAAAGTAT